MGAIPTSAGALRGRLTTTRCDANAKADAAATIKDAEDEADRILDKAENDRQKVIDAIHKLENDREEAREDYRDLLNDFITDATMNDLIVAPNMSEAVRAIADRIAHSQ